MLLSALLSSKVAAAALSTALVATGGAALAVNVSAQVEAADTVETPDVTSTPTPEVTEPSDEPTETESPESESPEAETTKGPDAAGPAAYGLCHAWANGALSEEKAEKGNAPSQNLIEAAGGVENVDAYCADVITAKDEAKGKPSATSDKGKPDKAKGKPSAAPEDDADEPDAETSPEAEDEPTAAPEESTSATSTKPGKGSGQKNKG